MGPPHDQKPLSEEEERARKQRDRFARRRPACFSPPCKQDANTTRWDSSRGLGRRSKKARRRPRASTAPAVPSRFRLRWRGGPGWLRGLAWLVTRDEEGGLPWPLRRVLEFDERLARGASDRRASRRNSLAPRRGCPASTARSGSTRASTWPPGGSRSSGRPARRRARIIHARRDQGPPRVEMTTELRCIEGWSDSRALGRARWPTWRRLRGWQPVTAGRLT